MANGVNLANAVVKLSGRKVNSYITSTNGTYLFNDLPAGGDYMIETTLAGYTFAPQAISNLQSNHDTQYRRAEQLPVCGFGDRHDDRCRQRQRQFSGQYG